MVGEGLTAYIRFHIANMRYESWSVHNEGMAYVFHCSGGTCIAKHVWGLDDGSIAADTALGSGRRVRDGGRGLQDSPVAELGRYESIMQSSDVWAFLRPIFRDNEGAISTNGIQKGCVYVSRFRPNDLRAKREVISWFNIWNKRENNTVQCPVIRITAQCTV